MVLASLVLLTIQKRRCPAGEIGFPVAQNTTVGLKFCKDIHELY